VFGVAVGPIRLGVVPGRRSAWWRSPSVAKRIELVDDIDGSYEAQTYAFAFEGIEYEIDLAQENAVKLRDALAPFIGHARRTSRARPKVKKRPSSGRTIRAWGIEQGWDISSHGPIPQALRDAYSAAHPEG
jgi:hypothetical protein